MFIKLMDLWGKNKIRVPYDYFMIGSHKKTTLSSVVFEGDQDSDL